METEGGEDVCWFYKLRHAQLQTTKCTYCTEATTTCTSRQRHILPLQLSNCGSDPSVMVHRLPNSTAPRLPKHPQPPPSHKIQSTAPWRVVKAPAQFSFLQDLLAAAAYAFCSRLLSLKESAVGFPFWNKPVTP